MANTNRENGNKANDFSTSQLQRLKKAELIELLQDRQQFAVTGEYPIGWHMKYRTLEGFEANLFVRGFTGTEVLGDARKATTYLAEHGATPWEYGSKSNGQKVETKPCPIHPDMELRKFSKNGKSWWSHKYFEADGSEKWCNGKVKKEASQ
jgi:hypothetical protein